MSQDRYLFLLSGLTLTLFGLLLAVTAAEAAPSRWSVGGPWGAVPQAGDVVTVPAGHTVIYDVAVPDAVSLAELVIEDGGRLVVEDARDTLLVADHILVLGELRIGQEGAPFTHRATIELTNHYGVPSGGDFVTAASGGSTRSLIVDGGTLDLHGLDRGPGWSRLKETGHRGDDRLVLSDPVAWWPGDEIVIAATDFDPGQAETAVVTGLATTYQPDDTVLLDRGLQYTHWGAAEGPAGHRVPMRAEVGLLTRNVVVRSTQSPDVGAQMRFIDDSGRTPLVRLAEVEVTGLGRYNTMGWYPVHFHMLGDVPGSYVRDCSIHRNHFRALTCHRTNQLEVTGNVAYDTHGHAYYLEDGVEVDNLITGNLGLSVRSIATDPIVESDTLPGVFYLTPQNQVRDNAAAGSEGNGFYYHVEAGFTPTRMGVFENNVAHSNGDSGLYQDDHVLFEPDPATYGAFVTYRNRRYGMWLRAHGTVTVTGVRAADNRSGFYLATGGWQFAPMGFITLTDSHVIGETNNVGNPQTAAELDRGRSLPNPAVPDQAIIGYEIYDGHNVVDTVWFGGFTHTSFTSGGTFYDRPAGAFGPTTKLNRWAVDPRNNVRRLAFEPGCNRVWFRQPEPGMTGVASAMLYDVDGTLTGAPGQRAITNTPLLVPAVGTAIYDPTGTSNAWVVDADYAQLLYLNREVNRLHFTELEVRGAHTTTPHRVKTPPATDHSRFGTNLLTADSGATPYEYLIRPTSGPAPHDLKLTLRFGLPYQSAVVGVPFTGQAPSRVTLAGGGPALQLGSRTALTASADTAWYWDATGEILWVKLVLPGGHVMDGLETAVEIRD